MYLLTPTALKSMIALQACKSLPSIPLIEVFGNLDLENKVEEGFTFLMLAASNANFDMVSFLVKNGVKTDTRNSQGYTALDLANLLYEKTKDNKYVPIIRLLDKFEI